MAAVKKKKPKLGSGKRFKEGSEKIQRKEGISKERADAIMAVKGREKYGKKKMTEMAVAGKKRKAAARATKTKK